MKRRSRKRQGKSHITALELKIHPTCIFVYVRRDSDPFSWKVYQRASRHSVIRIARVAGRILSGG